MDARGGRIEITASMRKLTDHSPLLITIWGQHAAPNNTPHYFDMTLLSEETYKAEMLQAWAGDRALPTNDRDWPAWLEAATERVMRCNARLAKERKRAQGASAWVHTKKVLLAETQFQRDPTNEEVRNILSDSQSQLAEFFQDRVARNRHLSLANWYKYRDTCSKAFFDFHRIGKKKTLLRELAIEIGTIMGQSDLTQFITDFYTNLYSLGAHALGTTEAQDQCWASVPVKVSKETNELLTKCFTLKETIDAIRTLPKGKAPGHDGVRTEFFQKCVDEVAPTFLKAFIAMLNSEEALAYINKGTITLIPKSEDRSKLSNWRLITLLGSMYKVLAKMLAGRLQGFLPHIIRPNQTGFVEGRSILDNTFLAQEALEWAEESNQDLVLLLLDFDKTFDRIEWDFLFTALHKLGFNDTWVRWTRTLYHSASSTIKVNGTTGPDF